MRRIVGQDEPKSEDASTGAREIPVLEHGFSMVIAEEADCEPEDFLTISLIFCQEIFSKN